VRGHPVVASSWVFQATLIAARDSASAARSSRGAILADQPAEAVAPADPADVRRSRRQEHDIRTIRGPEIQRAVGTAPVVMVDEGPQDQLEMSSVCDQQPVQTLSSHGSDEAQIAVDPSPFRHSCQKVESKSGPVNSAVPKRHADLQGLREAGATGLEPATSGVTGAVPRTARRGRFGYLMRNEDIPTQSIGTRDISAFAGRYTLDWALVPNH
jgi:hypothetical protein